MLRKAGFGLCADLHLSILLLIPSLSLEIFLLNESSKFREWSYHLGHLFHLHISITSASVSSHVEFGLNSNSNYFLVYPSVAIILEEHFGLGVIFICVIRVCGVPTGSRDNKISGGHEPWTHHMCWKICLKIQQGIFFC